MTIMIDGKATLTVLHDTDRNTEQIGFECDHGITRTELLGGDGESLKIAVMGTLAQHECGCAPEVFENLYPSLKWLLNDLRTAVLQVDGDEWGAVIAAHTHAQIEGLVRRDCVCDPHVRTLVSLGQMRTITTHRDGCDRTTGPARMTVVELGGGVT